MIYIRKIRKCLSHQQALSWLLHFWTKRELILMPLSKIWQSVLQSLECLLKDLPNQTKCLKEPRRNICGFLTSVHLLDQKQHIIHWISLDSVGYASFGHKDSAIVSIGRTLAVLKHQTVLLGRHIFKTRTVREVGLVASTLNTFRMCYYVH